jgi:tetratricopeptide (TPR) repeat protein
LADAAQERADEQAAQLCHELAYYLWMHGAYDQARLYCEQALAIRKNVLGSEHADTAKSLNNLALIYQDLGDDAKARDLFEYSLRIHRMVHGPVHPEVESTMSNLAVLLIEQKDSEQRDYNEAESLFLEPIKWSYTVDQLVEKFATS